MSRAGWDGWEATLHEQIGQNGRLFFQLAFGVLRDAAAAEDACQQAFLMAWQERARIHSHATLKAWLAKTVVRASLQMLRRDDAERRKIETHAQRARQAGVADGYVAPPGSEEELREAVVAAMAELPELTRMVVAMRVMQDLPGNEVKDLLGCSAVEVSRHLRRGLEHLRQTLRREERS